MKGAQTTKTAPGQIDAHAYVCLPSQRPYHTPFDLSHPVKLKWVSSLVQMLAKTFVVCSAADQGRAHLQCVVSFQRRAGDAQVQQNKRVPCLIHGVHVQFLNLRFSSIGKRQSRRM